MSACFADPGRPGDGAHEGTGASVDPPSDPSDAPAVAAAVFCQTLFSCACESYAYGSVDNCEARETEGFRNLLDPARHAALRYDPQCMAQLLDAVVQNGCAPETTSIEPLDECAPVWCAPYHGDVELGERCTRYGLFGSFSDCTQGLACRDATCQLPCEDGQVDDACEWPSDCGDGLGCDLDGRCAPAGAIGDPCVGGACEPTAYCDEAQVCRARKPDDAPCSDSAQCASDDCDDERCSPTFAEICDWLLPGQAPF